MISTRERIRQELASAQKSGGNKEKSLQLCFLNEAVFEEEEEEDNSSNNKQQQQQQPQDLSSEIRDSVPPLNQRPSALFIAKNNISKKKNHVIIPLTPTSAKAKELEEKKRRELGEDEDEDEEQQGRRRHRVDIQNLTEDTFALYLRDIRLEAREKLKQVRNGGLNNSNNSSRNGGSELETPANHARCFIRDLERLFGLKGGRKFSRLALTGMNTAQLQVILEFLLSRIEELNESLVRYLISRDELVMEQDALLTDVEDITKGIGGTGGVGIVGGGEL